MKKSINFYNSDIRKTCNNSRYCTTTPLNRGPRARYKDSRYPNKEYKSLDRSRNNHSPSNNSNDSSSNQSNDINKRNDSNKDSKSNKNDNKNEDNEDNNEDLIIEDISNNEHENRDLGNNNHNYSMNERADINDDMMNDIDEQNYINDNQHLMHKFNEKRYQNNEYKSNYFEQNNEFLRNRGILNDDAHKEFVNTIKKKEKESDEEFNLDNKDIPNINEQRSNLEEEEEENDDNDDGKNIKSKGWSSSDFDTGSIEYQRKFYPDSFKKLNEKPKKKKLTPVQKLNRWYKRYKEKKKKQGLTDSIISMRLDWDDEENEENEINKENEENIDNMDIEELKNRYPEEYKSYINLVNNNFLINPDFRLYIKEILDIRKENLDLKRRYPEDYKRYEDLKNKGQLSLPDFKRFLEYIEDNKDKEISKENEENEENEINKEYEENIDNMDIEELKNRYPDEYKSYVDYLNNNIITGSKPDFKYYLEEILDLKKENQDLKRSGPGDNKRYEGLKKIGDLSVEDFKKFLGNIEDNKDQEINKENEENEENEINNEFEKSEFNTFNEEENEDEINESYKLSKKNSKNYSSDDSSISNKKDLNKDNNNKGFLNNNKENKINDINKENQKIFNIKKKIKSYKQLRKYPISKAEKIRRSNHWNYSGRFLFSFTKTLYKEEIDLNYIDFSTCMLEALNKQFKYNQIIIKTININDTINNLKRKNEMKHNNFIINLKKEKDKERQSYMVYNYYKYSHEQINFSNLLSLCDPSVNPALTPMNIKIFEDLLRYNYGDLKGLFYEIWRETEEIGNRYSRGQEEMINKFISQVNNPNINTKNQYNYLFNSCLNIVNEVNNYDDETYIEIRKNFLKKYKKIADTKKKEPKYLTFQEYYYIYNLLKVKIEFENYNDLIKFIEENPITKIIYKLYLSPHEYIDIVEDNIYMQYHKLNFIPSLYFLDYNLLPKSNNIDFDNYITRFNNNDSLNDFLVLYYLFRFNYIFKDNGHLQAVLKKNSSFFKQLNDNLNILGSGNTKYLNNIEKDTRKYLLKIITPNLRNKNNYRSMVILTYLYNRSVFFSNFDEYIKYMVNNLYIFNDINIMYQRNITRKETYHDSIILFINDEIAYTSPSTKMLLQYFHERNLTFYSLDHFDLFININKNYLFYLIGGFKMSWYKQYLNNPHLIMSIKKATDYFDTYIANDQEFFSYLVNILTINNNYLNWGLDIINIINTNLDIIQTLRTKFNEDPNLNKNLKSILCIQYIKGIQDGYAGILTIYEKYVLNELYKNGIEFKSYNEFYNYYTTNQKHCDTLVINDLNANNEELIDNLLYNFNSRYKNKKKLEFKTEAENMQNITKIIDNTLDKKTLDKNKNIKDKNIIFKNKVTDYLNIFDMKDTLTITDKLYLLYLMGGGMKFKNIEEFNKYKKENLFNNIDFLNESLSKLDNQVLNKLIFKKGLLGLNKVLNQIRIKEYEKNYNILTEDILYDLNTLELISLILMTKDQVALNNYKDYKTEFSKNKIKYMNFYNEFMNEYENKNEAVKTNFRNSLNRNLPFIYDKLSSLEYNNKYTIFINNKGNLMEIEDKNQGLNALEKLKNNEEFHFDYLDKAEYNIQELFDKNSDNLIEYKIDNEFKNLVLKNINIVNNEFKDLIYHNTGYQNIALEPQIIFILISATLKENLTFKSLDSFKKYMIDNKNTVSEYIFNYNQFIDKYYDSSNTLKLSNNNYDNVEKMFLDLLLNYRVDNINKNLNSMVNQILYTDKLELPEKTFNEIEIYNNINLPRNKNGYLLNWEDYKILKESLDEITYDIPIKNLSNDKVNMLENKFNKQIDLYNNNNKELKSNQILTLISEVNDEYNRRLKQNTEQRIQIYKNLDNFLISAYTFNDKIAINNIIKNIEDDIINTYKSKSIIKNEVIYKILINEINMIKNQVMQLNIYDMIIPYQGLYDYLSDEALNSLKYLYHTYNDNWDKTNEDNRKEEVKKDIDIPLEQKLVKLKDIDLNKENLYAFDYRNYNNYQYNADYIYDQMGILTILGNLELSAQKKLYAFKDYYHLGLIAPIKNVRKLTRLVNINLEERVYKAVYEEVPYFTKQYLAFMINYFTNKLKECDKSIESYKYYSSYKTLKYYIYLYNKQLEDSKIDLPLLNQRIDRYNKNINNKDKSFCLIF